MKDLVGKTVGSGAPGTVLHQLVVALLVKENVDYTKVNFVNVGSATDSFKAIVAGTVDAGVADNDVEVGRRAVGVHHHERRAERAEGRVPVDDRV